MDNKTKIYYMFLIGVFLIPGGIALIAEHLLNFGYLEFEPQGHETYGLILAIIGSILLIPYIKERRSK